MDLIQENESRPKKVETAMWYFVEQIAQREAESLNKTVTPDFVATLADVVYKQAETMAMDLESFSKHAKRSTVSMDDVLLCARRNNELYKCISEKAAEMSTRTSEKRKRSEQD
ncbi:kinetochore component CENP-S-domain-containing protein [Spinellus fusiger]|nr:kinetochore component CENP-S-domain-containing protein [Spinellus fusiger]